MLDRHNPFKKKKRGTAKAAKEALLKRERTLKALAEVVGFDSHAETGEAIRAEARRYARIVASPFPGLIFSDIMRCTIDCCRAAASHASCCRSNSDNMRKLHQVNVEIIHCLVTIAARLAREQGEALEVST